MSNSVNQIISFIEKCKELKNCKFIMATGKIKDLLKHIVNCPELYELFSAVTRDFDYIKTRKRCLVDATDGIVNRSYMQLPDTVGERLAFIFCLFVDIDRENINFNWLLQRYFAEDGSYYSSYQSFCTKVVDSLIYMLNDVFAREIAEASVDLYSIPQGVYDVYAEDDQPETSTDLAGVISSISILISQEKDFVNSSSISDEEKETGCKILDEIFNAVRASAVSTIDALMLGYNYFMLYNQIVSESISALVENVAIFEQLL